MTASDLIEELMKAEPDAEVFAMTDDGMAEIEYVSAEVAGLIVTLMLR